MSEGESTDGTEAQQPIDREIMDKAAYFELPYDAYKKLTPKERSQLNMVFARRIKSEAKRRGIPFEQLRDAKPDERKRLRDEHPERWAAKGKPPKAALEEAVEGRLRSLEEVATKMRRRLDEEQEEVEEDVERPAVHVAAPDVPSNESIVKRRKEMTIGEVRATDPDDLPAGTPARYLEDIYSRWPVGPGKHYLRVERVQPKVWNSVNTAGYVAKIETPINEAEFQRWFGGTLYHVTVYGPDKRGRCDDQGHPIIKRKTEPIVVTVPYLDPDLRVLPAAIPSKREQAQMNTFNPFAGFVHGGEAPVTPAAAQVHKTNADFVSQLVRSRDEELKELRNRAETGGKVGVDVARVVSESNEKVLEQQRLSAEKREQTLLEQLQQARKDLDELRKTMTEKEEARVKHERSSSEDSIKHTDTLLSRQEDRHRGEITQLNMMHQQQLETLRETHKEQVAALRETHRLEMERANRTSDETRQRERERYDEQKTYYQRQVEELEKKLVNVREEERKSAEARLKDVEKNFERRIEDLKENFKDKLEMREEHAKTRLQTTETKWDMEVRQAKREAEVAKEERDDARREAEENKDPVKVLEKGRATAEALGYQKTDESGPQTAMERLATTLGMGLGKAFEEFPQWGPKMVDQFRGGAGRLPPGVDPRQLQQGAPPPGAQTSTPGGVPQQRPVQQQQRSRAVAWASRGEVPVEGRQPITPPTPVGVQSDATPPPPAAAAPAPEQAPAQPEAPAQQQPATPATNGQPPPELVAALAKLGFSVEIAFGFRNELHKAISVGYPAESFADQFAQQYPQQAQTLALQYTPDQFFEVVKLLPDAASSPILRPAGKTWVKTMWKTLQDGFSQQSEPAAPPATAQA